MHQASREVVTAILRFLLSPSKYSQFIQSVFIRSFIQSRTQVWSAHYCILAPGVVLEYN